MAITGLGLFIYGFWLSKNIKSNKPAVIFSTVYILLVSVLTFFTSNVLYAAGVEAGTIVESVHYFSFSLIEYLLFVSILSAVIFILSPKVLYKEIHTTKAYVCASLLGLAIVVIIYFIMIVIMNTLFTDPESVKESYEILVGSVGFGYIGFAILIILNRSKAKGVI
ncbi:hypothetical protein [Neobacillus sp. LXY-4]|uniref:hypothetical protein n=1 Tax=Neobacillus sp. LXY-4 TaxID=3379826 RepID=UPI003EDECE0F